MGKQCAIIVPVYTTQLAFLEIISLKRTIQIWGNKYDIILMGPEGLNYTAFQDAFNYTKFKVAQFDPKYFKNNLTYSDLLLSPKFYQTFINYEFLQIAQLDTYVFSDKLDYFISLDYDYIGALHFHYKTTGGIEWAVGNGGFSLRKTKSCLDILLNYESIIAEYEICEDRIFGEACANVLKIAPIEIAKTYSYHDEPEKFYEESGHVLPMGAHAINKHMDFYYDKMETYPLVSVIVPVYNMEKYVFDTLNSIRTQTYENWECIIINDGSTDSSEDIILKFIADKPKFKYIRQSNAGVAAARNNAIRFSKGKYILPVDPDDIILHNYIKEGVSFLDTHSDYALFYSHAIIFGHNGADFFCSKFTSYEDLLKMNQIHNSAIYRKKDYVEINGYNEKLKGYEDWDFYIRLLYHNDKVYFCPTPFCLFRTSSSSRNTQAMQIDTELRKTVYKINSNIYNEFGFVFTGESVNVNTKISFIIPNRGGKHLDYVSLRLRSLYPDCEILVITQEDDTPFKRGQLFNIGFQYAKFEYMCFIDNDMFLPNFIDLIGTYDKNNVAVLQPFSHIQQVVINENDGFSVSRIDNQYYINGSYGGATFMSKTNFKAINGFSNLYAGWGFEDNEYYRRCLTKGGFKNVDSPICHIMHPKRDNVYRLNTLLNASIYASNFPADTDNYNNTIHTLKEEKKHLNYKELIISNVTVDDKFPYKDILSLHHYNQTLLENIPSNYIQTNFDKLTSSLKQYVTNDYILIGLPKHMNLGDSLIWKASLELLKTLPYKKKDSYFWGTSPSDFQNITPETIIIFNGGGFLSDIWDTSEYIKSIITSFPNNRIIFLPNTVYYTDSKQGIKMGEILSQQNIVIYSREQRSLTLAKKYFPKAINLLMPDTVLTWNVNDFIIKNIGPVCNRQNILYISRNDVEKDVVFSGNASLCSDWPTLQNTPEYIKNVPCLDWENTILDNLITDAINFILPYQTVYSDRMHGAILAFLLGKTTYFIDNSYHKTSNLYQTWLEHQPNTYLYNTQKED